MIERLIVQNFKSINYYAKFLAEKISMDDQKQYFITTHNPYFLQSVVEKTAIKDLAVNLVTMDRYKTDVTALSEKGKEEILNLSSDTFLNFANCWKHDFF